MGMITRIPSYSFGPALLRKHLDGMGDAPAIIFAHPSAPPAQLSSEIPPRDPREQAVAEPVGIRPEAVAIRNRLEKADREQADRMLAEKQKAEDKLNAFLDAMEQQHGDLLVGCWLRRREFQKERGL